MSPSKVFLLSPARLGGPRTHTLLRAEAQFDLAIRLREGKATIGEAYAFISGLYFRGKIEYSRAFAAAPEGVPPALVMVPGLGLLPPDTLFDAEKLQKVGSVAVDQNNSLFRDSLIRDAASLHDRAGPHCRYLLLGSIATPKYTEPLVEIFGERLLFPAEFVGRGDMSRGGLMLRCAQSGEELSYIAVKGANRHGRRPAKLDARKGH